MVVELICVGTELLLGNIVNTNAAYLSEKLRCAGRRRPLLLRQLPRPSGDRAHGRRGCAHAGVPLVSAYSNRCQGDLI